MPEVHVEVPIRFSDCGGWTDTWFAIFGKVLNCAGKIRYFGSSGPFRGIEVIVRSVQSNNSGSVQICAADPNYDVSISTDKLRKKEYVKHNLLLSTLYLIYKKGYFDFSRKDITIWILSPIPPGASLGTSAAVSVVLIKAFCNSLLLPDQIAHLAWLAETKIMDGQSGIQDQYAAAYAKGVNYIVIERYPEATCHTVKLSLRFRKKLEERLMTIFYGKHDSSAIHRQVIEKLKKKGAKAPQLVTLRTFAPQALRCLENEDLVGLGKVMSANTEAQAALADRIVSLAARSIIKSAKREGALGWKVNGAGGAGGSITILHRSRKAAERYYQFCQGIFPDAYIYFEHQLAC